MVNLKLHFSHAVVAFHAVGDKRIVLCYLPDNTYTPFASWRVDSEGNCYWGHYASNAQDASEDFVHRTGSNSETILLACLGAIQMAKRGLLESELA